MTSNHVVTWNFF